MEPPDATDVLRRYLAQLHDAVRWKLEGLSERRLRLPLTPTGSNLLGITKHLAIVEFGYLGDCMGRPGSPDFEHVMGPGAAPNADMFATAEESADEIVDLFSAAGRFADATLAELPLDARGEVPWWPEARRTVTLHQLAVHLLVEIARHVGHLDLLRELTDASAGLSPGNDNLPGADEIDWEAYVADLRRLAESFSDD